MVTLEATTREYEGVTLVEATLSNDGPDARLVRVGSELDGPVWPPRREGVPAAGWDPDEGTLAVSLSPGDRVGVGFASPAPPADPPLTVLADRPATDDDGAAMDSPEAVVRTLGDPSPPDDAVPEPSRPGDGAARDDAAGDGDPGDRSPDREERRTIDDGAAAADAPVAGSPEDAADDVPGDGDGAPDTRGSVPGGTPHSTRAGGFPAVTAWLAAVERRIDDAEDGGGATPGPGRRKLDADADRLRTLGRRAVALAERADELAGDRP